MVPIARRWHPVAIRGLFGVLALAWGTLGVRAEDLAPPAIQAPSQPTPTVQVLNLATCRALALERQPTLSAAQASLNAAQARARALEATRGIPLVTRDLPTRRQQSSLGVSIAQAQTEVARHEVLYSVSRTYWTAVFARQQLQVAEEAMTSLKELRKEIEAAENWAVQQIDIFLLVASGRKETAIQGYKRALAALREAMGVGEEFPCFEVADATLPQPTANVCTDEIVQKALSLRPELAQASLFAEITCQEVKAQASRWLSPTLRTFAAGADIHATQVPQGSHNGEYRPGSLTPEMPTMLAGSRSARVEQAQAYSTRANSVVDKARNLIALEARDAVLKWEENSRKWPQFESAAGAAQKLADKLGADAKKSALTNVTPADAGNARALAIQMRIQANEALFQMILDLVSLERVTAGGFQP